MKLLTELKYQVSVYTEFSQKFTFLSDLMETNLEDIMQAADRLQKTYPSDIEESFGTECIHLKSFLQEEIINSDDKSLSLSHLYRLLISKNLLDLYPNVAIALKIYLSTPASVCSAERSFSTLARIKNYLRSTQTQNRLIHLAVLAIENDLTTKLDYEDVISKFAHEKARRKPVIS